MSHICKCGNREFKRALEPVTQPLQQGVTPEKGEFYLRCSNDNCQQPITEALELKLRCPDCDSEAFRTIGPTEVGNIISGKMYPQIMVMVVECTGCGGTFGEDQLEEQAVSRAYDDGFVSLK
jgi:hypothetical protein